MKAEPTRRSPFLTRWSFSPEEKNAQSQPVHFFSTRRIYNYTMSPGRFASGLLYFAGIFKSTDNAV